ncbi:MAG: hypothetical protein EYC62_09285 [Alphaproteobacteria bacterium]|nr:MAG: hypothetical protein EYC62_09285 [Alphaproteobacteria bacterium]
MIGSNKSIKTKKLKNILLFSCLLLAACTMPRENIPADVPKTVERPTLPENVIAKESKEAILDLELTDNMLVPTALEQSDALPEIMVDNFSAIDATAVEAFRLLMMDKGIAVSTDETANDVKVNITNYTGKLQDVMERISETAGVFYTYRKGLVRLSKDRSFILPLPPLADALTEMSDVITNLGAQEVKLDKSSRMITFRASRQVFDNVSSYLERLRDSKVMIVYETYFLEVALNNREATGINWQQVSKSSLATSVDNSTFSFDQSLGRGTPALNIVNAGAESIAAGGLSFGALFTSGSFNINVLFDFLSSQGNVQTISRPTITILSGSKAKFEVGRKKRYVSKVSVTTTEGVSGNSKSVETEDLSLGLKTEILGDYSDNSIFTSISLSIDDLVNLEPVSVEDTQIRLPETTKRELNTSVRVRPGDAILIAGINQTRDQKDRSGPFSIGDWIPLLNSKTDALERSELVIVLKPRIVRFKHPEPTVADTKPTVIMGSSALVPPQGTNNLLTGVAADPNISSQMIYTPDGAVSVPTMSPANDDWKQSWGAPIQSTVQPQPSVTLNTTSNGGWYQDYNPSMTTIPNKGQNSWDNGSAPVMESVPSASQAPNDRMYDAVTAGDTYSKSRGRLPTTESAAPVVSPAAQAPADPLADSFGYYGKSGARQ